MTTITINERTSKGKSLLEFLRIFEGEEFIQINKTEIPNLETRKAMKDSREGKVNKFKNSDELFMHLDKKINVQP